MNITRTGILKSKQIISHNLTLPDQSEWKLMLFHYVDKGNHLFTKDNAGYCNEWGLYSRLQFLDKMKYDNKYEFYVIQDDIVYRWTQTSSPTASSIAGMTVIQGNPVNGIADAGSANTYFGYGSWWGACGCWTKYTTGGVSGIPGFGPHGVEGMCTEYLALYARVPNFQVSVDRNQTINGNYIYEI